MRRGGKVNCKISSSGKHQKRIPVALSFNFSKFHTHLSGVSFSQTPLQSLVTKMDLT